MSQLRKILFLLYVLAILVVVTGSLAQEDTACPAGEWRINGTCADPQNYVYDDGWNTIEPGGDTHCAHDTEFKFWLKPGGDDLLFYVQGGGGCWNQETCREGSQWYKQVTGGTPNNYRWGIFENRDENPFLDYTTIFVPSCTGDTYTGTLLQDYGDGVEIYHYGFIDMKSAIDFAAASMPEPDSVFVTGCSAGSVGSAFAAPYMIEQYPGVRITQLGDSLGSIYSDVTNTDRLYGSSGSIPNWIEAMPDPTAFTMSAYYSAMANYYPDYQFAQYNTQFDEVQQRYFGSPDEVRQYINAAMDTISESAPNFDYFVAGGDLHCILPNTQFYSYTVGETRLVDWVAALAKGEEVESIHCEDCDRPETIRD